MHAVCHAYGQHPAWQHPSRSVVHAVLPHQGKLSTSHPGPAYYMGACIRSEVTNASRSNPGPGAYSPGETSARRAGFSLGGKLDTGAAIPSNSRGPGPGSYDISVTPRAVRTAAYVERHLASTSTSCASSPTCSPRRLGSRTQLLAGRETPVHQGQSCSACCGSLCSCLLKQTSSFRNICHVGPVYKEILFILVVAKWWCAH